MTNKDQALIKWAVLYGLEKVKYSHVQKDGNTELISALYIRVPSAAEYLTVSDEEGYPYTALQLNSRGIMRLRKLEIDYV